MLSLTLKLNLLFIFIFVIEISFGQKLSKSHQQVGIFSEFYQGTCNYTNPLYQNDTTYYCSGGLLVKETCSGLGEASANNLFMNKNDDLFVLSYHHQKPYPFSTDYPDFPEAVFVYAKDKWRAVHIDFNFTSATCILETESNEILVGTRHGLLIYDSENWTKFTPDNSNLPDIGIYGLLETNNNLILVSTNAGLLTIRDSTWEVIGEAGSVLENSGVTSMSSINHEEVLITTTSGFGILKDTIIETLYTPNIPIPLNSIISSAYDSDGVLFIGSSTHGMARLIDTVWDVFNTANSDIPAGDINDIILGDNGEIFIASSEGGIGILNGNNWTTHNTSNSNLINNDIHDIALSKTGTLFAGINEGLTSYNGDKWTLLNKTEKSLQGNRIRNTVSLDENNVYLTTTEGVSFFDGVNWKDIDTLGPLLHPKINAVIKSTKGELLFGTDQGLIKMDTDSNWTIYNTSNSDIQSNSIADILETANGDIVLAADGLTIFDGTTWTNFNTLNSEIPASPKSIIQIDNGSYFMTSSIGLIHFDGTNWQLFDRSNSELRTDQVEFVHEFENNKVYVSNEIDAIVVFDGTSWIPKLHTGHFIHAMDATESGIIYAIEGNLLTKFDGENWSILEDINPILWDTHMDYISLQAYDNGTIYIGTPKGLITAYDKGVRQLNEPESYSIQGIVYHDLNKNGIKDSLEYGLKNQPVLLNPNSRLTQTNSRGEFSFKVTTGSYQAQIELQSNWVLTTTPQEYIINIDSIYNTENLTFGLTNTSRDTVLISTNLTSGIPRCNSITTFNLYMENRGGTTQDISIDIKLDPLVSFISSISPLSFISEDSLTLHWEITELNPFQSSDIRFQAKIPDHKSIDELMTFTASSTTTNGEVFLDTLQAVVRCSYDPNDKLVKPVGIEEDHLTLFGDDLTYTVRFQNTGNDTAFTVVVKDTIDFNLDMNTFEVLASSHEVYTLFDLEGNVSFTFNDIMLPDSNVNELESHGFVSFKISPKSGLEEYTEINNTAYIFFDFNPPIVTNETWNTLVSEFGVTAIEEDTRIINTSSAAPNPFSEATTIHFDNPSNLNHTLELFDVTGKVINTINNVSGSDIELNRNKLRTGMYFYSITDEASGEVFTGKLVVE